MKYKIFKFFYENVLIVGCIGLCSVLYYTVMLIKIQQS